MKNVILYSNPLLKLIMKLFNKMQKFKNSEMLSKNGFYLPSGLAISNKEIDVVGNTLLKILKN